MNKEPYAPYLHLRAQESIPQARTNCDWELSDDMWPIKRHSFQTIPVFIAVTRINSVTVVIAQSV
jgi:hypothetical protein